MLPLQKNPNSYGALVMLGQFASQKKEYEKAADYLTKALALVRMIMQRLLLMHLSVSAGSIRHRIV